MFVPMRSADVPPSGNNSDSDDSDSSPPPLVWSESDSDGDSDSSSSSGVRWGTARPITGVDVMFERATEGPIGVVPHFVGHTHNDVDAFFSFMMTLAQHARAVARACNSQEP